MDDNTFEELTALVAQKVTLKSALNEVDEKIRSIRDGDGLMSNFAAVATFPEGQPKFEVESEVDLAREVTKIEAEVLHAVRAKKRTFKTAFVAKVVCQRTGCKKSSVTAALSKLAKAGHLERVERGVYRNVGS